jgi:hypothetical protein
VELALKKTAAHARSGGEGFNADLFTVVRADVQLTSFRLSPDVEVDDGIL